MATPVRSTIEIVKEVRFFLRVEVSQYIFLLLGLTMAEVHMMLLALLFLQLLRHLSYLWGKGVKEVLDELLRLVFEKYVEILEYNCTCRVTFDSDGHNVFLQFRKRLRSHHLLILRLEKFIACCLQLWKLF